MPTRRSGLSITRPRHDSGGFTLLELLAVLLILSTVAALVVPNFSRSVSGFRLHQVVRETAALLRQSRSDAIARMNDTSVRIDLRDQAIYAPETQERLSLPDRVRIDLPHDVRALRNNEFEIRFNPDGTSTGGVLIFATDRLTRYVTVDWMTGRVRVE